jgi:Dolichyl-phosphate-mannose-protein mannosyltransferase
MRRVWPAVLGLTLLGGVLRFATLDTQSFWLDELVTVSLLDRGFDEMLDAIPESEATPYLYYVLAWPWAQVFGLGEVGVRSLSALVGTAVVPVTYGAGASLVSRRVGLVAAALVAVHPFLVWYSQEARAYSLLALLAAGSVLFLARALEGRRYALPGWAVASSLAIATHYFAVFLVAAEAFWLVWRRRTPALLASTVPAAVLLLHLPLLLDQRGAGQAVADSGLARRVAGIPKALVVGYSFPAELAGTLVAAALVVAGLALLALAPAAERRRGLVAGALALVSLGVPVLLALGGSDYVIARNAILAIVPGAICLATGYAASRLGLGVAGALCALGLAITLSVSLDDRYGRTDWRGAAARLERTAAERAVVVTPFLSRQLWAPYFPGLEEPAGDAVEVREIAAIGLATEEGFNLTGPVEPPPPNAAPPPGFRVAEVEETPTYTLVLYRAPVPQRVSVADLHALRLSDQQAGILLQRP